MVYILDLPFFLSSNIKPCHTLNPDHSRPCYRGLTNGKFFWIKLIMCHYRCPLKRQKNESQRRKGTIGRFGKLEIVLLQQHQVSVLFKLLELKHLPYLSWSHSLWFFTSREGIPPANPSLSLRPFLKASHKEVAPWILNPWMLYLSVVLGRMKMDFPFDYSLHIFHRYGAEFSSSSCLKWDTACRFSTCVERKVFLSTFVVSVNNWYLSHKVIDIIQQKLSRTCLFSWVNQ